MATLQQALSAAVSAPAPGDPTPVDAVAVFHHPCWVGYNTDFSVEVAPHLKKVYLYLEEDWNVSSGGGASMMADRRLRLSELPLKEGSKSTRQCEFGVCYCEEMDLDSGQCSSGFFEEGRWLIGTIVARKGAKAHQIWPLVPDLIVQDYDRFRRSRDLSRWEEGMPSNY